MRKRLLVAVAAGLLLVAGAVLGSFAHDSATAAPTAVADAGFFMHVQGQRQGEILGGGSGGRIDVLDVGHDIVSPRDPASGLPTGKRQHKPFTIVKELDRSTPPLLAALVTNENLTSVQVTITGEKGVPVARIDLVNASVAQRSQHGNTEEISFTYQKIVWTWLDGGITAEDDWQAPDA